MSGTIRLDQKNEKLTRLLTDFLALIDEENKIGGIAPLKKIQLINLGLIPDGGTTGQVLKKTSEDDLDVEWGDGGGSGGSGVSVTTNIVRVEPNAEEEVVGKLYFTYADALAYVLLQTPSEINPWVIELPSGAFSENIEFNEFISIKGNKTLLTGTLSTTYTFSAGLLNNTTYIEDCIITDIDLSTIDVPGSIPLIFTYKCILNVSTFLSPESSVCGIINRDGLILSGDFSINALILNYNTMILGGEYAPNMEGFGHALKCEHCQIYGGTYNGGQFILCYIASEMDYNVLIEDGEYKFDNCTFNIKDAVVININSENNVFNNCTFNRFSSGVGNNSLTFGSNSGNIATFNNCYFENMDVTHTNPSETRGTLNLNNCSGTLTFVGDLGTLQKNCKECYYDTASKIEGSNGEPYQVAVDGSYIYFCTATNTWRRITLDTIPAP